MTCPSPKPRLYREHAALTDRLFYGAPLTEGERRRLRKVRRVIGRYSSAPIDAIFSLERRKHQRAEGRHDRWIVDAEFSGI
jgi:hypothetical protein